MYLRLHNAEIQKETIDEIAFENQFNDGAEYLNKESVISDKTKEGCKIYGEMIGNK